MGSEDGNEDEKPVHNVTVSSFKMGKYPVTVAQYKTFCQASGQSMPEAPS
jgi:formylglycine-generating enzyme required for sulfatase activity